MFRITMMFWGLFFMVYAHAFPCYVTMVKDSCWTNYNLSVNVTEPVSGKIITTINIPKGKSWVRQAFTCQPEEILSFIATFSPIFWASDQGKTYPSMQERQLPAVPAAGDTAWNIQMCYPADFSEVPLPPDATNNCKCDTDSIPPIKPQ